MYYQFLIEDRSTDKLVNHIMKKLDKQYAEKEILWNTKFFGGIGHLRKGGSVLEQKTGKLLNDLPMYMKAFDKVLQNMDYATLIIVLDNDTYIKMLFLLNSFILSLMVFHNVYD